MPLEDDQKAWLETALSGKGVFASIGIKKQFNNYTRRRKKVAEVADPLPRAHSNYLNMHAALGEADKQAKDGKFDDAYKSLRTAKALAQATDAGTSGHILENEVAQSVKLLEQTVSAHLPDVDGFFEKVDLALAGFTNLAPCSGKGSVDAGVAQMKVIVALEPNLRGTMTDLQGEFKALDKRFTARQLTKQVKALRDELDRLTKGGHADVADKYSGRVDAADNTYQGKNGKYTSSNSASMYLENARIQSEKTLFDRKDLKDFMNNVQQSDGPTENIRSTLKPLDIMDQLDIILRDAERDEEIRQQYLAEKDKDSQALAKTGAVDLELMPEPPQFQAADVLGDIDVKGALKADDIDGHVADVSNSLKAVLTDAATPKSVLLDLMSKSLDKLSDDVFENLFHGQDRKKISAEQERLVAALAEEMFDRINQDAPNKVSPDADTVTVGGQTYNKVKVLKSGGLGTATLFKDLVTGRTMVMKTPLSGNQEASDDLLGEMKIMNRAQEGAVGSPDASAIPEFYGAARGEDGSMHMLMEYIDGGDMSEVSATMNAIGNSGMVPRAALKAMQGDMVGKAAKALGELQRQGLMHHDIKGLNIMMTKTGEVKIIDYGESTFVGEDGTAKAEDMGNATPGYIGKEGFRDGATVTVDNFALGSMLMSMVEQRSVHKWNKNESDTGALGRLIQALHQTPDQRVSLEGLAQSAFMTSADTEYGEESMSDLRKAATEFTQQTKSLKSDKSYDEIRNNLKNIKSEERKELFSELFEPSKTFGLDDAQDLLVRFDEKIETIMRDLRSSTKSSDARQKSWLLENRQALAELTKAKAYVQSKMIDETLDKALAASTDAYQQAVDDPDKTIEVRIEGRKKELTLKDAVAKHADLVKLLQLKRNETIKWLETADGDEDKIQKELDERNSALLGYNRSIRVLKGLIEKAAGPAAALHFSKERLDAASVPFGPSEGRRKQDEIAEDEITQLLGQLENLDVSLEVEKMARTAPS